jgi:hypothetical protein
MIQKERIEKINIGPLRKGRYAHLNMLSIELIN